MPVRMIKVRSTLTGDTALIPEKAFGLFAANYERLDQPTPAPSATAEPPAAEVATAPPAAPGNPTGEQPPTDPATPATPATTARRAAAKNDKEQ